MRRGFINRVNDPEADGDRFIRTPKGTAALKNAPALPTPAVQAPAPNPFASAADSERERMRAKMRKARGEGPLSEQFARDLTVPFDWSKGAGTHEEIFSGADWEPRPAQGGRRPARIRLNRQAAMAIGEAGGGRHFTGLHIPADLRAAAAARLAGYAERLYRAQQISPATLDKLTALSRDIEHYSGADLVVYRSDATRALGTRATDLIEEFTHWAQHEAGEPSRQLADAVAVHPAFSSVAQALRGAYGTDRRRIVTEMGVKLAAGKWQDVGVTRETGLDLLKAYYSALAIRHGAETADRILRYTDRRVARECPSGSLNIT